jgi:hypothetical protein
VNSQREHCGLTACALGAVPDGENGMKTRLDVALFEQNLARAVNTRAR